MDHHYYVANPVGYAVAESIEEALEKLVNDQGRKFTDEWVARLQKSGDVGLWIFTCRVHLPVTASYSIEGFQPQGVETSEGTNRSITRVTKKEIYYTH